jgi:hypothetical protein
MGNETQQKATENSNKKLVSRNKNFAIPAVEKGYLMYFHTV